MKPHNTLTILLALALLTACAPVNVATATSTATAEVPTATVEPTATPFLIPDELLELQSQGAEIKPSKLGEYLVMFDQYPITTAVAAADGFRYKISITDSEGSVAEYSATALKPIRDNQNTLVAWVTDIEGRGAYYIDPNTGISTWQQMTYSEMTIDGKLMEWDYQKHEFVPGMICESTWQGGIKDRLDAYLAANPKTATKIPLYGGDGTGQNVLQSRASTDENFDKLYNNEVKDLNVAWGPNVECIDFAGFRVWGLAARVAENTNDGVAREYDTFTPIGLKDRNNGDWTNLTLQYVGEFVERKFVPYPAFYTAMQQGFEATSKQWAELAKSKIMLGKLLSVQITDKTPENPTQTIYSAEAFKSV